MKHTYTMTQKRDGHNAESVAKLGDVAADGMDAAGERMIGLNTYKSGREIVSVASVHIARKSNGYSTKSFDVFGDYRRTVAKVPCARVTAKAIEAAHVAALEYFSDCIEGATKRYYSEAKAQYAAQPESVEG